MDDATRKQKLSEFYNDDAMKEVVKSFLIDTLKSETIERVFKRLEVSGIADAKIRFIRHTVWERKSKTQAS
jgi:hypothetical protein